MTKEMLLEQLPHGSGINGEWQIEEKKDKFLAINYYETMDEWGFYDGIANFTLVIPKLNPNDFLLHFNGSHSQYQNRKYLLREYLEDIFAYALSQVETPH